MADKNKSEIKKLCPEPCYDMPLPSEGFPQTRKSAMSECYKIKLKWEKIINCRWRNQFDCPHLKDNEEFIRDMIDLIDRLLKSR